MYTCKWIFGEEIFKIKIVFHRDAKIMKHFESRNEMNIC